MFLLLILPILVSGFIVCSTNPYYFPKLHRFEGQLLYLKSAQLGTASLICFSLIALIVNNIFPAVVSLGNLKFSINVISFVMDLFEDIISNKESLRSFAWIVTISVGSIVFSYIWCGLSTIWLMHKTIRELALEDETFIYKNLFRISKGIKSAFIKSVLSFGKIKLQGQILSDSPLDSLFFHALFKKKPVFITLESRKVYVGMIHNLGEPTESEGMDQEISIVPIMSGYRDEETLNVEFITYYEDTAQSLELVIRQDQILSATFFDFDAYDDFIMAEVKVPTQAELDFFTEPST